MILPSEAPLSIGTRLWFFDGNRRVYAKAPAGREYALGGPIYREHFVPRYIVGAVARSWLLATDPTTDPTSPYAYKVGRTAVAETYYTDAGRAGAIFVEANRRRAVDGVQCLQGGAEDAERLRRVLGVLGLPAIEDDAPA